MKYLYIISALLLLVGSAFAILRHWIFDLVYIVGGAGYVLYYVLYPLGEKSIRERRLVRMNVFAGLLFLLSGVARLGLLDSYGQGLWIFFLLIGLIFMLYANILIGRIGQER